MLLGILCTMINGFGRKGFYNSQEIGLGRCLCQMGHKVIIYKGIAKKSEEETIRLEQGNLIVHYIAMKHIGANGIFDAKRISPELDGLLCFSDQQLFLLHIFQYCKKHFIPFVPYIGTAHSLYTGTMKGHLTNKLFSLGTLKIYQNSHVLAKTPSAKMELLSLGVEEVEVDPVGLDVSSLNPDYKKANIPLLRKKYGFLKDSVLLCNISRMQPEKRILELIDLFDQIKYKKKFEMLLIGEGDLEGEVDRTIKQKGLEAYIKRIPKIPYDQIWEIYAMSDYYVNMNKGEIFGMACMEAVYYQTSVAAIKAIGPRITLKDMSGHKLCEDDLEIAEWLCAPYPDKKLLAESANKAEHRYSWQQCANAFVKQIQGGKI